VSICRRCRSGACSSSPKAHPRRVSTHWRSGQGPGLIVVGSSHRSSIGRIVIGGTGESLLSGASAPVAVAPAGYAAAGRRIQVVGCGFDGSPESHRALAWSAELARGASARLRVLSV
jgi:nucleotide-binding universal stress UspA family protein